MIIAGQRLPIVIATRPVDFRRGHDCLAATVQNELGPDPHSGLTVIFRSKRGDRLKILVWDGTGLVLVYKRLEQGSFAWPKIQDGVMRLSRAQFETLFEGLAPLSVIAQQSPAGQWAPGCCTKGAAAGCGRMTQWVGFGHVLLGFLRCIGYEIACRSPSMSASFQTCRPRW
ncbi:MAG: transposase [Glaciecola sp.]|jgi:transposase